MDCVGASVWIVGLCWGKSVRYFVQIEKMLGASKERRVGRSVVGVRLRRKGMEQEVCG